MSDKGWKGPSRDAWDHTMGQAVLNVINSRGNIGGDRHRLVCRFDGKFYPIDIAIVQKDHVYASIPKYSTITDTDGYWASL